jgi:hypothetical protein
VALPDPTANLPVYAIDDCQRTVSNGWGSATLGGTYTLNSPLTPYSVSGGACRITLPTAGSSRSARLTGVSARDVDLSVTISTDKGATGGGQMAAMIGRVVGSQEYRARVRFAANGQVYVAATRLNGGTETVITELLAAGVTHAANTQYRLRAQLVGASPTTIRIKVWPVAGAEPAGWNLTTTDSTAALQAAGAAGLNSYISSSTSNAPVTFAFDDFTVRTDNAAPVAVIGAPSCTGLACTFSAAASTDDGTIASYGWSFGDGATASGATPDHTFAAPGTYRVYLTVTDTRVALAFTFVDVTVS